MGSTGAAINADKKLWQEYAPGEHQLYFFDDPSQRRSFAYQDIHRSSRLSSHLCGVIEHSGRPLLYIANSNALTGSSATDIDDICHSLACRGEESFLAELSGGTLTVFPCLLNGSSEIRQTFTTVRVPSLIRGLSEGIIPIELAQADKKIKEVKLRKRMLDAFMQAAVALRNIPALKPTSKKDTDYEHLSTILALLGRVLFMCFLCDRNLAPPELGTPRQNHFDKFTFFTSPESAAWICHWQDETFNGDFLPLLSVSNECLPSKDEYISFFKKYPIFNIIQEFANGEDGKQFSLIRMLNFKHVPIGLLSEVYETFAHKFFEDSAHEASIHYTPRHIASVLLEQAFQGISPSERRQARILDPSAGAGVFLVLALRLLVKEHAEQGQEISASLIRNILYAQLRGMDISIHALRLSTLALYLAAIDLDPNPSPVTKQHFDIPLLGKVLHCVDNTNGFGALGEGGNNAVLDGPFDLVIGNPPWTKISQGKNKTLMRNATYETAKRVRPNIENDILALNTSIDKLSPDYNPAFPFLWRSLEWTKSDGIIAFVLPAEQILFREYTSRNLFFRNAEVTGIVNGSDLHKTNFWEGMEEPFCLFFARNAIPNSSDSFLYLNVYFESLTSQQHRLRIDSSQARKITNEWLEEVPYLLKVLFRGTELDLSILEKLQGQKTVTLGNFLRGLKGNGKLTNGYAIKKISNRLNEQKRESTLKRWTENYCTLRELDALHIEGGKYKNTRLPLLNNINLPSFNEECSITFLKEPRDKDLYAPPLLIVPQAASQNAIFYTGNRNVIFSQSYFGMSFSNIDDAPYILTYISILFQSQLPKYHALLTSARYGCNWNTVLLCEIEEFPITSWENLDVEHREFCKNIFSHWEQGKIVPHDQLFEWATNLYGLNSYEKKIISDTLETKAPGQRFFAQSAPQSAVREAFLRQLRKELVSLFEIYNTKIDVQFSTNKNSQSGWIFVDVIFSKSLNKNIFFDNILSLYTEISNKEGVSEIVLCNNEEHKLHFGILNQNRYWTYSQARLFAQKLKGIIGRNKEAWGLE